MIFLSAKKMLYPMVGFIYLLGVSDGFANTPHQNLEPTNLATIKKQLITYHDSGLYSKQIDAMVKEAKAYLKTRVANPASFTHKKPAIVLDIDETVLSNYPSLLARDFGGNAANISADIDKGIDKPIKPMLDFYRYAQKNHIAIFFLTGRSEAERNVTIQNLEKAGYTHWQALILRNKQHAHTSAVVYKSAMRKQISDQGYDIVLNIGDQQSDLTGGYADKSIKLPNPYYFIA